MVPLQRMRVRCTKAPNVDQKIEQPYFSPRHDLVTVLLILLTLVDFGLFLGMHVKESGREVTINHLPTFHCLCATGTLNKFCHN